MFKVWDAIRIGSCACLRPLHRQTYLVFVHVRSQDNVGEFDGVIVGVVGEFVESQEWEALCDLEEVSFFGGGTFGFDGLGRVVELDAVEVAE